MPELPDVEMQRRYLAENSLNKRIKDVQVHDSYVIKGVSDQEFVSKLKDVKFIDTDRRGKFLEVYTDSGYDLAIHFGMTGHLKYTLKTSTLEDYTRVVFTFTDDHDLRYVAMRKLGGLFLVPEGEFTRIDTIKNMGPEPLNPKFNFSTFEKMTRGRSAKVKALLMDQAFIAGIGNLFADEILFQAEIRPDRRFSEFDEEELKKLFDEIKRVLHKAIQNKARIQDFEDFAPHRREGEDCPRCGYKIHATKISGRTSYYCEKCQK